NARGSPDAGAGPGRPLTAPLAAALQPPEPAAGDPDTRPRGQVHPNAPGGRDRAGKAHRVTHERAARIMEVAAADRDVKLVDPAVSVRGRGDQAPGSIEVRRRCGRRGRHARGSNSACESENAHAVAGHWLLLTVLHCLRKRTAPIRVVAANQ